MAEPRSAYLKGAAAVWFSKAASIGGGALTLYFLTQVLSKEALGGYVFVMSLVTLCGLAATLGLDRALLLRLSSRVRPSGVLKGRTLALRSIAAAVLAATVLAVLLTMVIRSRDPSDPAQDWVPLLTIVIPLAATSTILQIWFQANHRVAPALTMRGLIDGSRSLFFGLVLFAGLGATGIGLGAIASTALPLFVLGWLAYGRTSAAPGRLSLPDLGSGLQFLVIRLSNMAFRQGDVIFMGLLATGAATAEYAVAVRIGMLVEAGRDALQPTFTPRARLHIARHDDAAAAREYHASRFGGLLIALAGGMMLTLFGPWVLSLFGDFRAAYPPLLLLVAGYALGISFGMHATYLQMSGELRWSIVLRVSTLALLFLLLWLLIPPFGGVGAATAVLLATLFFNVVGVVMAQRMTGLAMTDPMALGLSAASVVILGAAAFGQLPQGAAAALLGLCLLVLLWQGRDLISAVLRRPRAGKA